VSDNLTNAENVLIVEGEDDKIVLEKLLPFMSGVIKNALSNGILVIDYLAGAGNLNYKITSYRDIQCRYHVLLDYDDAGKTSGAKAEEQGLATIKNITYTICNGSSEAELEDCFDSALYQELILNEFDVDINKPAFRGNKKWSDRMRDCFLSQGKPWGDAVEKKVKLAIANHVSLHPAQILNVHKRSSIDALKDSVERMIVELAT
jgi:predicted ATP-dependent endonuclease of OLD family